MGRTNWTQSDLTAEAVRLRSMLLDIYRCQKPFELSVKSQRPKTTIGRYYCESNKIIIYIGWLDVHPMEEIAIHEYAHHIHFTEKTKDYRLERPHGKEFWRIYSALMAKAYIKGIFNDHFIDDIMGQ